MGRNVLDDLKQILKQEPSLPILQLAQRLRGYGWPISNEQVKLTLESNLIYFEHGQGWDPTWRLRSAVPAVQTSPPKAPATPIVRVPAIMHQLETLIRREPGRSADQLRQLLVQHYGQRASRTTVNRVLGSYPDRFRKQESIPPLWYPIATPGSRTAPSKRTQHPTPTAPALAQRALAKVDAYLGLWPWQQGALRAWEQAGYRGVVEAVTGTGKTRVGIAAAAWAAARGLRTLVIVPTVDLQTQWYRAMLKSLDNVSVGRLGDGERDGFDLYSVLITTVQSCCRNLNVTAGRGLLIADECHRYGADSWARTLQSSYRHRLGLTATYERSDDGVAQYLAPYFERTVYTLGYPEALRDNIIAHFKIGFLGVRFAGDEQADYDEQDQKVRWAKGKLIYTYGLPDQPFGTFMKAVTALTEEDNTAGRIAQSYLAAFTARRKILAEARAKLARMGALGEAARRSHGTIVFTQTKDGASHAANALAATGLATRFLHSDMDREERRRVLGDFADGDTDVIAAPKLLDEGIDVPEADLAIIMAASNTRLQMVQRMGRVLRKKPDGRLARVVIMYVIGTSEDPATGAHEAFLDLITPVAEATRHFGPTDSAAAICAYLNDFQPSK